MKKIDYKYIATSISKLSGIPIRIYKNKKLEFFYSFIKLPIDPISPYSDEILKINKHVGYYITNNFEYYGIVNSKEYSFILGPSLQTKNNEQYLKELAFKCDLDISYINEFIDAMNSLNSLPLDSILEILITLNYLMNDEKLSLKEVTIYDSILESLKINLENNDSYNNDNNNPQNAYNTLLLEENIIEFIRKGDLTSLNNYLNNLPPIRNGVIANNQLRQIKNTFIVLATLASRAAIRGGMDKNDALSLSDLYIQKCELMNSIDKILNLQYMMVIEYTTKVNKLRLSKYPSKLINNALIYIEHHLNETLTTSDISKALYISRSRLSTKFKEETGIKLKDYILSSKIEEAKRLLRYSDKSLIYISSYLGFSSQSHFSNVFKKYTNILPNDYRKKYN